MSLRLEKFVFAALWKCVGIMDFGILMGMLGPRKIIFGTGKMIVVGFLILEDTSKKNLYFVTYY
jgi:hypothetical protein